MRVIAVDTETARFGPGQMAPPLACVSWRDARELEAHVEHWSASESIVRGWLEDGDVRLVGHNVAYDACVLAAQYPDLLPLLFAAYEDNRITDTMLRQKLIDIAYGEFRGRMGDDDVWVKHNYSLLDLTRRYTGKWLEKDEWRLKYGELREQPLVLWPDGALHYAREDARATFEVYEYQALFASALEDEYRQARAAFWLHLMSVYGLMTAPGGVQKLIEYTESEYEGLASELLNAGLVRYDKKKGGYIRNMKAVQAHIETVCTANNLPLRKTDKGGICTDADACEATEDALLKTYAEFTGLSSVLAKDIPALASGVMTPIHSTFGIAATGRTTSAKPNVQNWRRLPGIRECFVPRPGYLYANADYDGLELRTLAQVCISLFGHSELGTVLNQGLDPHLDFASKILHIDYGSAMARKAAKDPEVLEARQMCKAGNFGFPGGLGLKTFILFAAGYGVELAMDDAATLRNQWFERWKEMRELFAYVKGLLQEGLPVRQLFSNRFRGGCTFPQACNTTFQGLGADATKHAGFLISKACYVDEDSPLYGCRTVNYIHDEFIVEVPDDPYAPEAAAELGRLMCVGANEFLPDVPATTSPFLSRYWSKEAEAVYNDNGVLIPWGNEIGA